MKVKHVSQIQWQGGELSSYVVLKDGPLENDSIVAAPSLYLLHLAKETKSGHSVRGRAEDLKTYFAALHQVQRDWRDITDNQMSGYLESTLVGAIGLGKKSIARHCSTIKNFYSFGTASGLTDKHFNFSFEYKSDSGTREQGESKRKAYLQLHKKYINESLFEILVSNANETQGFLRDRDELVMLIGYHMGLRTAEVTRPENLSIVTIKEKLTLAKDQKKLTISLDILGKGDKIRSVNLNAAITEKISDFIKGARSKVPGDHLICTKGGSTLSDSHATRVFNHSKKISLMALKSEIRKLGMKDNSPYTISFKSAQNLTFHCLRHTFTTDLVTYCLLNNIDPYAYIPGQLGHDDDRTTREYTNFEASIYNRDLIRAALSKNKVTA